MPQYKWIKLFKVPRGHKFFRDAITGMVALADDSGSTPDRTEDGVLWLDYQRCVTISDHGISIPLLQESRSGGPVTQSATPASVKEAIEVCTKLGMRLAMGGERYVLVREGLEVPEQSGQKQEAAQESNV